MQKPKPTKTKALLRPYCITKGAGPQAKGENFMASAKQLPSGSWRVQLYVGKDPRGKRQYLSFTAPTKKEAELEALTYQLHYKEVSRDATAMTLKEAVDKYISSKDGILSPSTIRGYDVIRRNRLQGLMPLRLNRLTNAMIQQAINAEAKPYKDDRGKVHTPSPKYIRNIYGLLSATLREYHPSFQLNITLPQKQVIEQKYLEPEQISVLMAAVRGTEMEIPVLLALWLSLRSSEVTGLTWECVDFDHSTITVRQAKVRNKDNQWVDKTTKTTNSTRTISAPDYIMDLLRFSKGDAAPTDHVVDIKGNCLYQRLRVILKNCGLPPIRFHDLRHTNASVMAALNVPELYAQKRGGWSSPAVMKTVYQHALTSTRNAVDQSIDSFFYGLMEA